MPEKTNVKQPLPSGPTTLCFNKEEFRKDDFNVELFVVECRRRVPMEGLRDDLGVYLKVLQSAMIELINKDYADFVNLSTNLVGLDKAINSLISPLSQLQDEVLSVRSSLDAAIDAVEEKMKHKHRIRQKKACLQRLQNIMESVQNMEKLLGIQSISVDSPRYPASELTGQLIERVATEFNKLQFYVNRSRGLPLVEDIKPRIANITTTLQYSLEDSFREGLETGNLDVLRQCLRTYATIDKMRDAENLFRQHVVRPFMEEGISEQCIRASPLGLSGMYAAVIDFIPRHCKKLKDVTSGSSGEIVRGYDFLVNAVWPEIVSNIEARTPSIFAPGNPNVFHEKYQISVEFVEKFEWQCGSQASVKRLRAHPSYNTFMSRWSLPVYFQIRFQEIAGAFEGCLSSPFHTASDTTLFHLNATLTLWQCLHRPWEEDIYLAPLCHRFWKLTLQLLARYTTFIQEVYQTELRTLKEEQEEPEPESNGRPIAVESIPRSATPPGAQGSSGPVAPAAPAVTMGQIVCLIADVQMLNVMIPDLYLGSIKGCATQLNMQNTTLLEDGLSEAQSGLMEQLPKYGQYIVEQIIGQCSSHLKTVNDIPRLYRKTNREIPSKASPYVAALIRPISHFLKEHQSVISDDNKTQWLTAVIVALTEQYHTATNDVLTSVKKMEESLKRLKKAKSSASLSSKGSSASLSSRSPSTSSLAAQGLSDDDKIRLQLCLDVEEYGMQIDAIGLESSDIGAYNQLMELVESAKNNSQM